MIDIDNDLVNTIFIGYDFTIALDANINIFHIYTLSFNIYLWFTHIHIAHIDLNLTPTINAEGRDYKFMGVYAKNREEWILTTIANMKNSVATIAFYDTLGPAAVEFVIR